MEEDIKILEEYLRIYKEINEKYDNYFVSIKEIPIQAIENLLARSKELEEKLEKKEKIINKAKEYIWQNTETEHDGDEYGYMEWTELKVTVDKFINDLQELLES